MLKYLKNDKLDPTTNPKRMKNDDVRICVINMMCVLHNVMKVGHSLSLDSFVTFLESKLGSCYGHFALQIYYVFPSSGEYLPF